MRRRSARSGGRSVHTRRTGTPACSPAVRTAGQTQFVLAIVSLGVSIPLTAIGAGIGGLQGLVLVWVGIVLLNFVYGWTHRRP